jgi:hypothetical protein
MENKRLLQADKQDEKNNHIGEIYGSNEIIFIFILFMPDFIKSSFGSDFAVYLISDYRSGPTSDIPL